MKLKLSLNNPLCVKQRISKTFHVPPSFIPSVNKLLEKSKEGGMIIIPIDVEIITNERLEFTTIFISTMVEGYSRIINKLTEPEVPEKVTVNKEFKNNDKPILGWIKSFFR